MLQSSEFVDVVCTDTEHKVHWVAAGQFADIVALHSEHWAQSAVRCSELQWVVALHSALQ